MMKIFADFNGIEFEDAKQLFSKIDLTGYGTIADLSNKKVKLEEGMEISFFDPDGMIVKTIVIFDENKIKENCSGWFGRFRTNTIQHVDPIEHKYKKHSCFNCGEELSDFLEQHGRHYKEICPYCSTPIMTPLHPPNTR